MTTNTTATVHKLKEMARPFGTVTIRQDGSSTSADIVNEGTINFVVDFPPGTNVCTVKLNVDFSSVSEPGPCEPSIFKTGGGTIVIGG
jgi:hypothetical protein